ncbi:uncharacterized protein BT62DRAFT_1073433 [Guyanagaster necrorhizus]|uniref:Uncharacterized protein n=1 Tax=Guyanagaster necrorhizus TaxID=856835 RepID=A0A9P7VYR9_9AGAR|nr:uncharacterized protein BT62DRAFT_1073433 [Guyanagaster necrorhizus MCA 3950]KAG7450061.1 hypothetical protein BT62DRAFT_1073433 [Guyanagaster necrorhizus MCA 3950]
MFKFLRRKAKGRKTNTGVQGFRGPGGLMPNLFPVRKASSNGLGLDPRSLQIATPGAPSSSLDASPQTIPLAAFPSPLPDSPTKITSISDIVFDNAAFDALLDSRNGGN